MADYNYYGPITRAKLADLYRVNVKTIKRKLKVSGIRLDSGLIYPAKLKEIFETFRPPPKQEKTSSR